MFKGTPLLEALRGSQIEPPEGVEITRQNPFEDTQTLVDTAVVIDVINQEGIFTLAQTDFLNQVEIPDDHRLSVGLGLGKKGARRIFGESSIATGLKSEQPVSNALQALRGAISYYYDVYLEEETDEGMKITSARISTSPRSWERD